MTKPVLPTMLDIVPTNDHVIVRRLESEPVTERGIHVPETARRERWQAEVVAVGPGKRVRNSTARIEPEVVVGDLVLISEFTGMTFERDYQRYACVRESEIMAVVG